MINQVELKVLRWWGLLGSMTVSLFLTPTFSGEPVDLPKMFILVPAAFFFLGFVLQNFNQYKTFFRGVPSLLLFAFFLDLVLVLLFSGAPFNQQFFGAFGRNTGFISYTSLILIFLAGIIISNASYIRSLALVLLTTGAASLLYGYLQYFKHDPIKWNNPYNPIIAFLGNPDFSSSFLGMSTVIVLVWILRKSVRISLRICSIAYFALAVFLIIKTHAQQGLLVLGLSSSVVLVTFLYKSPGIKRIFSHLFTGLVAISGSLVVMGIFKVGPLATHLYKFSVRQRGFYWHAAVKMMASHPFLGIGLDSYGDNYLKYRSANAAHISMTTQSNAAHNVFLDLASSGGFPLLILSISLFMAVLIAGIKVLKNSASFEPYFAVVFASWIGYQAQSIVSINQLGLAVWGWILGGSIIGYSHNLAKGNSQAPVNNLAKSRGRKVQSRGSNFLLFPAIGVVFGLLLVTPPFLADHKNRIAMSGSSIQGLIETTNLYPEDLNRTLNAANLLAQNKYIPQALKLAKHVVEKDEKSFNAWALISKLSPFDSQDYRIAIQHMKVLNPYDTTIK